MRIDDGYGHVMLMPFEHMGLVMLLAIIVLLAIGFGIGCAVGRAR